MSGIELSLVDSLRKADYMYENFQRCLAGTRENTLLIWDAVTLLWSNYNGPKYFDQNFYLRTIIIVNYGDEILKWIMYIFEESVHIHDNMMRHDQSIKNLHNSHWNGNAIILMKFSSLAATEVVKTTIFSEFSEENFIKMTTYPFSFSVLSNYAPPSFN